ncbi:hypothetical protein SAMN02745163_00854 [Clostridium cavendishii DSM 21758]|uniref:Uncharacterized protein n=1 Tax=Clostridium cavendishii DSM 21758 TaxID=1121302 RepID=A0A1M6EHB4_9CLOT|nr:hypothetical protein [Clostridium cavendishii]SHI84866.1 hypothetical protein SAMN02745163_00854 [Clostridium cavendishii DSM 21758]
MNMNKNVIKGFIFTIIIASIIIIAIFLFTFNYKTRPDTIRENIWDKGKEISEKYLDSIKNMEDIKLVKLDGIEVINLPSKNVYKFIKNNEEYEKWIYEDLYNIKKNDGVTFNEDEKMVLEEISKVYEALRSCDESIKEYDTLKYKERLINEESGSKDMLNSRKENILESINKLKVKTSKLENIYGFKYGSEIDKLIKIINQKL